MDRKREGRIIILVCILLCVVYLGIELRWGPEVTFWCFIIPYAALGLVAAAVSGWQEGKQKRLERESKGGGAIVGTD